jgi:hypothetical protein
LQRAAFKKKDFEEHNINASRLKEKTMGHIQAQNSISDDKQAEHSVQQHCRDI